MKRLFFISCVVVVICLISLTIGEYSVKKDIDGWLNRAQVAADATQMHTDLERVKNAMEENGMTSGYATYIWKTPDYNMAEIYKSVTALVKRADIISDLDESTTTYQVALDDLRGAIRELDLYAWEYKWRHSGYLIIIILLVVGSGCAVFVGMRYLKANI